MTYVAPRTPRRPKEFEPAPGEVERAETQFSRADARCDWEILHQAADAWAKAAGLSNYSTQERLEDGDRWYPYVLVDDGERQLRICGWNDMVECRDAEEETWRVLSPPQHGGAHWNGGGSTLYFEDGTFKFNTHGHKERKGSEDYPVIEDLAGDHARALFPDRYVVLPDGREGISTEGLSKEDLKVIMRDTGHRVADRGERYHQKNLKEWRADIRRRLEDMGCNPDLGWE